jgi:hypothetical protein
MRTKTLAITAALAAAGALTSMAQAVYSVNAVGYINLTLCPGFSIIANQLDAGAGNNTVSKLFAGVPDETVVYKFVNGAYTVNTFEFGAWERPDETLVPGEAAFVKVKSEAKVTFVGEVPQGNLTTPLVAGFQLVASQVPQSGQLDTVLGWPAADEDVIYFFKCDTQAYDIYTYEFGAWDKLPVPAVGQGFFAKKKAAATWTRTFSVNN